MHVTSTLQHRCFEALHAAASSRLWLLVLLALCPWVAVAAGLGWQAPLEVTRGAGERGPWQQNESRYDFVDDPTVAWSRGGELALAWVDQRRKDVLLQRYAADGKTPLGRPVDVSRSPATFSWLPRLAWAPDDPERLYVLWQEIMFSGGTHGGEIFLAVSSDGGRSFELPLNLSNSRPGDGKGRLNRDTWHNGSFAIAVAPGGKLWAAWTEYDGRLWLARSVDAGRSFSHPRLLAGEPPAAPVRAPALAIGPNQAVVLAWTTGENPAADIMVAVSSDGGERFSQARAAAVTPGHADAPKLAFDARGVLHLVHAESRGGPFQPSSIHHLRSSDGGRSFGPPKEISESPSPGQAAAGFPAIGIDARGRVVVSWELLGEPHLTPRGLGSAVSEDGVQFAKPQAIPDSADPAGGINGSTQGLLMEKLAVRADG
ncbi:MAG TPA: sialidase family protein, partial [Rubrivivax sp.]|nr:sialidase family protein [Rubrivivax sp.]